MTADSEHMSLGMLCKRLDCGEFPELDAHRPADEV